MHNQRGVPLIAILALLWHVAKQFVLSEQCNETVMMTTLFHCKMSFAALWLTG